MIGAEIQAAREKNGRCLKVKGGVSNPIMMVFISEEIYEAHISNDDLICRGESKTWQKND